MAGRERHALDGQSAGRPDADQAQCGDEHSGRNEDLSEAGHDVLAARSGFCRLWTLPATSAPVSLRRKR